MPTLPNMTLITPTLGADRGTWDDKINAVFALIDAHDHTSGKGVAVPIAGLDIDDDLAMGGFYITGLGKLAFTAITAPSTGSKALFVSSSDNELYWRTNSGTNVKLTSGTSINTSLVGGIVGDYSSVGAELSYSDADKTYKLQDESATNKWVRMASGPVRIYEHLTTESVYVEHAVDAALAAPYTVTWPATLPANPPGIAIMQITTAGIVSFSNAMPELTGDVTATGEVTGTDLRHTTAWEIIIPGARVTDVSGSHTALNSAAGARIGWLCAASTNVFTAAIDGLKDGDVITGYTVYLDKDSGGTGVWTSKLYSYNAGTGPTETAESAGDSESGAALNLTVLSETGLTVTVDSDKQYYIIIDPTAGCANDSLYHVVVKVTRP